MGYLNESELAASGFRQMGRNVKISRKATILRPDLIRLGSHVRIDDFCIISPTGEPFDIGSYVHIGPYSSLIGAASITMSDFSGLSARVTIYSSSDDYTGSHLTNPTVPAEFRNVISKPVELGKHVIVGTGAAILPGVRIGDYSAIAAMSLVNRNIAEGMVAGGQPCRNIKPRLMRIKDLEARLREGME